MGGRGSSSGLAAGQTKTTAKETPFNIPKVSSSLLKSINRSQLETLAAAIYANNAMKSGLSQAEGVRRARALMSGNTDAQLRRYIKKYGS